MPNSRLSERSPSFVRVLSSAGAGVLSVLAVVGVLATACGGELDVDGYPAMYVDNPPIGIAAYPRYPFHDGYVYEVGGRYYHEHHGRWAVYRDAPREIAHQHPEPMGRAEHQR